MNVLVNDRLVRTDDNEVRIGADEPVLVNKEYGPLVFTQLRVTAEYRTCEWVVERQFISSGEWFEVCRIPGQLDEEFST